jgi:putative flippase GtrA
VVAFSGRSIQDDGATASVKAAFHQLARFVIAGLVNTAIGLAGIYGLMFFFGVSPVVANAAGYSLGLIVGFALNRSWTFRSGRAMSGEIPRYLVVVGVCYLANLAATVLAMSIAHLNAYLSQLLGLGVYTSLMYCGCRWFVFSPLALERAS